MAKDSDLIKSPAKPIAEKKQSPGTYNGEPGSPYPKRTQGSGPDEKTYEAQRPSTDVTIKTTSNSKEITGKK